MENEAARTQSVTLWHAGIAGGGVTCCASVLALLFFFPAVILSCTCFGDQVFNAVAKAPPWGAGIEFQAPGSGLA